VKEAPIGAHWRHCMRDLDPPDHQHLRKIAMVEYTMSDITRWGRDVDDAKSRPVDSRAARGLARHTDRDDSRLQAREPRRQAGREPIYVGRERAINQVQAFSLQTDTHGGGASGARLCENRVREQVSGGQTCTLYRQLVARAAEYQHPGHRQRQRQQGQRHCASRESQRRPIDRSTQRTLRCNRHDDSAQRSHRDTERQSCQRCHYRAQAVSSQCATVLANRSHVMTGPKYVLLGVHPARHREQDSSASREDNKAATQQPERRRQPRQFRGNTEWNNVVTMAKNASG